MDNRETSMLSTKKRLVYIVIAIFGPFIVVESISRTYWMFFVHKPLSDEQIAEDLFWEAAWKKDIPYTFTPYMNGMVATTPARINNLGFRGDHDIDLKDENGKTRILCIGDSVTFGYTVSGNKFAYPAVLEKILDQNGMHFRVINGGMPRFRFEHMVNLFESQMPHLKPAIVLILGGWNDISDHVLITKKSTWNYILEQIEKHVYTLKVSKHCFPSLSTRFRHAHSKLPKRNAADIDPNGFHKIESSLRQLIKLSRQHGARPILCTIPSFFNQLNTDSARIKATKFSPSGTLEQIIGCVEKVNIIIRSFSDNENIDIIRLDGINKDIWFADAVHPNNEGSREIAHQINRELLNKKYLETESPYPFLK